MQCAILIDAYTNKLTCINQIKSEQLQYTSMYNNI